MVLRGLDKILAVIHTLTKLVYTSAHLVQVSKTY